MQGKRVMPICRIGWLEHARRKTIIMGERPSMEGWEYETHPNDRNYLGRPLCRIRARHAEHRHGASPSHRGLDVEAKIGKLEINSL